MDNYETCDQQARRKREERRKQDELYDLEQGKEQAERRARDAERRAREQATAAREELSYREEQVRYLSEELDEARADLRRERERVSVLVNAAREFMREMGRYTSLADAPGLNGEQIRAWQGLQEVCNVARPREEK